MSNEYYQPREYYTWRDAQYRDFMIKIITSLEPRYEKKHSIFADELDEFNEITFINTGQVVIGYEVNNKKKFCIKYNDSFVIGAYECTFNKRSVFIYKANTIIEGLFIRKCKWNQLMLEFNDVS